MPRTIVILFFLLLPFVSPAQFNDSIHYHFGFASTGVINKTNGGDSYVFSNGLDFNTKSKYVAINTNVVWIYGIQQKNLTNNDFSAHGDIDLGKGIRKFYYWGLLNYDASYSLKINHRVQAGGGVAYSIIDSPGIKIKVSDGFLFEQGNLVTVDLNHIVYHIPRNSFRLSYRFSINNKFSLGGVHYYQPSLKDISDYIIQSTSTISVNLRKWLAITSSLVYNKVSRTKRENLLITYGLTVEKNF